MLQKVLFEIPIYTMDKEKFENKWRQKEQMYFENSVYETFEEYKRETMISFCPYNIWQYNQILGYIIISVSKNDVWFERYLADMNRIIFDSKQKRFMSNKPMNGMHFYTSDMDNTKIIALTKEMLESVVKQFIDKKFYVDKTVFNNLIDNVDFKGIMQNI